VGVAASVQPGDVIGGTYVIERLLGEGGMGAVYVAHEERLGRRVAIKVLLSAVADNPEAVARFEREARSAAALQSDHVTRVLSVGQLASGAPYIAMELLEGEDLATLLAKRGALAPLEVVELMLPVCEALTEAHALGIVHRDLKPANIFLARRPTGATTVKVLDFGISKSATASASPTLTKTTAVMGTPMYMSPEQLKEAKSVDGRADVWALGVVMYELLAGGPPFLSDALAELCAFILTMEPEPLVRRRPDLPPALGTIVHRCLEKDPARRFADVRELRAALSAFAASGGVIGIGGDPRCPPRVHEPSQARDRSATPPREATPRVNASELAGMATAAIAARARAQAPTEAPAPGPKDGPVDAYGPPRAPSQPPFQVPAPQVHGPQVQAPQVHGPQVQAPQVQAPQVHGPQVHGRHGEPQAPQGPHPYAHPLALSQPYASAMTPPLGHGGPGPVGHDGRPMMVRTVDPVSSTTPEVQPASSRPPWLGIALAFGGTLLVAGGLGLYVALRSPVGKDAATGITATAAPSEPRLGAVAGSGAAGAASSAVPGAGIASAASRGATAGGSESAAGGDSAAGLGSTAGAASAAGAGAAAGAVSFAGATPGGAAPGGAAPAGVGRPPLGTPRPPVAPLSPPPGVALPPPGGNAPPAASARPAPPASATRPSTPPTSTSLMPSERN